MNIADILLIHEPGAAVPTSVITTLKRGEKYYDVEFQASLSVTEAVNRIDAAKHTFVCVYFEQDMASVLLIIRSLRRRYVDISIFIIIPTFSDFDEAEVKHLAFDAGATEVVLEHKLNILDQHIGRYMDFFKPRAGRILYVNHEEELTQMHIPALVEAGYKVELRSTAEEAWAAYRNNRYDLVLTNDMLMGVDSASNLVTNIRRLPGDSGSRPVVVMLSNQNDTRERALLDLGANEVLKSDLDKETVLTKVSAHISNNRRVKSTRFTHDSDAPLMDKLTHTLSRQALMFMWPTYIGITLRHKTDMSVALISVEGLTGLRLLHTSSEVNHALASIAEIIRQNLRAEDIMGRWSEDTFAVVIVDCKEEIAISVIKRSIRDAMHSMNLKEKGITLNGGLVGAELFLSADLDAIMIEARTALTEASSRGGGYVVSYSEIN